MRFVFLEKPDPAEVRRRTAGWRQVWVWLPAAVAVTMIAFESTDTFSAQNTEHWIRPLLERYFGHINDTFYGVGQHIARKSGHFMGFGVVCLTFLRAWLLTLARRVDLSPKQWAWRACGLAIACTAIVASGDEWHQTYIPSRTGSPWDVLLDSCGATIACCLVWLVFWRGGRLRMSAGESRRLVGARKES